MAPCYFGPTVSYSATGTDPSRACGPYTLTWDSTYSIYRVDIPFDADPVCGYLQINFFPPDPAVPSYGNITAVGADYAATDVVNIPQGSYTCSGGTLTYLCGSDCPILCQFGGVGTGIITASPAGEPIIGGGGDGGGGSPNGPGQGVFLPPVVAEGSDFLVFGSSFTGTTAVTVGGVPVTFTVVSDSVLQITVPRDGSVTTGAILVTNGAGSVSGPTVCIYQTSIPFIGKVSC
jgi:hypothetical protein